MLTKEQIKELLEATEELLSLLEDKPEDQCNCCSNESEDQSNGVITNSIVDCISSFLCKCTSEGKIPTLEEAQSICILEHINSKYN